MTSEPAGPANPAMGVEPGPDPSSAPDTEPAGTRARERLLRRGFLLDYITLGWIFSDH